MIINPKSEYRNPKQIQMTKIRNSKKDTPRPFGAPLSRGEYRKKLPFVLNIWYWDFGFVSNFGFRASDLNFI
jgi:hypothetical protein